jgi:hypothetical protein
MCLPSDREGEHRRPPPGCVRHGQATRHHAAPEVVTPLNPTLALRAPGVTEEVETRTSDRRMIRREPGNGKLPPATRIVPESGTVPVRIQRPAWLRGQLLQPRGVSGDGSNVLDPVQYPTRSPLARPCWLAPVAGSRGLPLVHRQLEFSRRLRSSPWWLYSSGLPAAASPSRSVQRGSAVR